MAKAVSKKTTDHSEIKQWVLEHGGKPVKVKGTGNQNDPGVLRIDFPGGAGEETFEVISWEDWFEKFDSSDLAFLYQERKKSGEDSTFFKLVKR
ncbi:hypothetical protein QA601_06065 [Chitinispirillales bacterium ANBcel5]|uniref:hypothetical protein n=1 Tax=Cellulosispirillum alkaliphilum TaxID=3039283 RepID=UPI002A4F5075|nr:hypothetical protein [Chitinispirillales bacterium ANBcel5]